MALNIQEKCAPVKDLAQASLPILKVRSVPQKCQQLIQGYEAKSYSELPAFLDYYCQFLPVLYIFHYPYSWLLVHLNVSVGDTVGITLHPSAEKRKWYVGTKGAEISPG